MTDLCQIAEVQAWLQQTGPSVSTSEVVLERLISSASAFVCRYCGRGDFLPQEYVDTYDGTGKSWMILRQWPVISIASIGIREGAYTQSITDASQYALEALIPTGGNQRLSLLGVQGPCIFPRGRGNVTITYTAGYDQVPFDVEQATIELIGEAFRRKERIGQNSVSMKDQSVVSFSQLSMNNNIAMALSAYRRLVPC